MTQIYATVHTAQLANSDFYLGRGAQLVCLAISHQQDEDPQIELEGATYLD